MTVPREPESVPDEGESATQPIPTASAEPTTWYPVDQPPSDAAAPPAEEQRAEEPPAAEPAPAEAFDHDTTTLARHAEPAEGGEGASEAPRDVPAGASAEGRLVDEPGAAEPAATSDQGDADTTTLARHAEPAGVTDPASERTAVVEPETGSAEPEAGSAERTVVVDRETGAEERTVAVGAEPAGGERTAVLTPGPAGDLRPPLAPTESIFRQPSPSPSPEPEPTRMEALSEEEQKLAAERAARREARAAALAAPAPVAVAEPETVIVQKRTNDKFLGSIGLFLLRLVLAAVFAVRGLNLLTDIPAAQAMFAQTILPEPGIMAIVTGVAALLIALSLVLGLLTRLAGLGIALIAGGALALVYWGNWSPFVAGRPGFLGDFELVVAAVGVLLMCIGGGGWSLDRSFRAGRDRDRAERATAAE